MQTGNSQSNVPTRPHGHIDLLKFGIPPTRIGEIAAMVIGKNGSGIRRYTSATNGSFVKLQETKNVSDQPQYRPDLALCQYIYISARSVQDVQKVALMVNQDIIHYLRGYTVQPSRPTLNLNAPPQREVVGFVIGRNGENLKRIQRFVGEECFIVHDPTSQIFRITANTTNACRLAECKIADSIREFILRTKNHQNPTPVNLDKPKTMGSRYECIAEQSDTDDDDSVTSSLIEQHTALTTPSQDPLHTNLPKKARKKMRRAKQLENELFDNSSVSSNGSIANIRFADLERKRVRDDLSKTTDEKGHLVYPDVDFWDNKSRRWVKLTGPAAVPWEDVEKKISTTRMEQERVTQNTISQQTPPHTTDNPPIQSHDTLTNNPNPSLKGCWSSPSPHLWDSNGVENLNAAETNHRQNKSRNTHNTTSYTSYEYELDLNYSMDDIEYNHDLLYVPDLEIPYDPSSPYDYTW